MKRINISYLISAFLAAVMLAACAAQPAASPAPTVAKVPPPTPAVSSSDDRWNQIVATAKKEEKVVIYGAAGDDMRVQVGSAFTKKYGIEIEWVIGRTNEVVQRIISERRAGIYYVDVLTDATSSAMNVLKPAGLLKPFERDLILPEVTDTSKWFQGKLWWVDKEKSHLAYAASPIPPFVINTDVMKRTELQSYRDILAPKWKDIMIMDDPTTGGSGNTWATAVGYKIMGDDFLRELVKQKPTILQNQRQEMEWVARGKAPILIGPSTGEYTGFKNSGAPIEVVTPKEGAWLSQSRGGISLMPDPPHPNAALVYLNWALSKEGQTVISKAEGYQSARIDVPTDFLEAFAIRIPDAPYLDTINFEYDTKKQEYAGKSKVIFAELMK